MASCASRWEQEPRTWALGTVSTWLEAILEGRLERLRGADPALATALIEGIHTSLRFN